MTTGYAIGSVRSIQIDADYRNFGWSVAVASDMDGNGVPDLLIGGPGLGISTGNMGYLYRIQIAANGDLVDFVAIGEDSGGFTGTPGAFSQFGGAVTQLGDVNNDGIIDIATSSPASAEGIVWILFQ